MLQGLAQEGRRLILRIFRTKEKIDYFKRVASYADGKILARLVLGETYLFRFFALDVGRPGANGC